MQVKSTAECSPLHSATLLTFIKLPFGIKTFVLSIFEWLLKTGFTDNVSTCFCRCCFNRRNRWNRLPIERTRPALKYSAAITFIIMLGCLFYLSEYYTLLLKAPKNIQRVSPYSFPRFFVKVYKFTQGTLEMKGHYMKDNITLESELKIEGMDVLLNDIKPNLLNDPKLEMATFPDQRYFQHDRNVKDVNCRLIINGDVNETMLASNYSATRPRKGALDPEDYINLTTDCAALIHKRGYVMSSLTKLEADFPIAFSLMMFRDVQQVELLLRAIYRPQNIYCIHVDKKSDDKVFKAMEGISGCFENVFLSPIRTDVRWATFSVLEPDLVCMEELFQRNKKWKYFINLTGQEFPLRTNYELVRILMTYDGANDISGTVKR